MRLKINIPKLSAGIPVAMLSQEVSKELGVHTGDRISIKTLGKNSKEINTIVDLFENISKKNELAVSDEIKKILSLKKGDYVEVGISKSPESLEFIKNKLKGKKLSLYEIEKIVSDIVENSLSEAEIALFVSAMYNKGMNLTETKYLIKSFLSTGNCLKFNNKLIADKHCVGGIPGNRTTPLVVSICASLGLIIPKNSSRAITSAAGTADVIETIAKVDFKRDELKKIVKKVSACLVWGGGLGLVPADSKIINIEKKLKIDPPAMLLASILSKKIAAGSKYILIDIPYGQNAKFSRKKALSLKRKFETLSKEFDLELTAVLTRGDGPIGNGVGPVLELIDIIKVLEIKEDRPIDLEKKSIFLSGKLLELTGLSKKGEGEKIAKEALYSGKALKKFKEIIYAQGGSFDNILVGKFQKTIYSKKSCLIKLMDNKKINSLARVAGCPVDKGSGVFLHKHPNEKIKKGEKLITIYAESRSRLNEAIKFYETYRPIKFK